MAFISGFPEAEVLYLSMYSLKAIQSILSSDIHAFLSLCLLTKTIKKYDVSFQTILFDFLKRYYRIPRFDYINPGLGNYAEVRQYWINTLEVLDSHYNIRRKHMNIIATNTIYKKIYDNIQQNVSTYIKEEFKGINNLSSV